MNQTNNTRELRREITKRLSTSEMWLVLRQDKYGVHIDTPNVDHLALFAILFAQNADLYEDVKEVVDNCKEEFKKYNK